MKSTFGSLEEGSMDVDGIEIVSNGRWGGRPSKDRPFAGGLLGVYGSGWNDVADVEKKVSSVAHVRLRLRLLGARSSLEGFPEKDSDNPNGGRGSAMAEKRLKN
jgi:hypothetical protein